MVDLLEQREVQKGSKSYSEEDIKLETLDQMMGIKIGLSLLLDILQSVGGELSSLEVLFVCFVFYTCHTKIEITNDIR